MEQSISPLPPPRVRSRRGARLRWLVVLFACEVLILVGAYQLMATLDCRDTDALALCRGLRSLVARVLAIAAVMAVLTWARPAIAARFSVLAAHHPSPGLPTAWHFGGVAMLALPLLIVRDVDMSPMFIRLLPFLVTGAIAAAVGGLLWMAPWAVWRRAAGSDLWVVVLALLGGAVLPDVAELLLPIWDNWQGLTRLTFYAVAELLQMTGLPVYVDAPGYIIGLGNFAVHIAQQCSGVEGLALITGFTVLYAALMWKQIHLGRYWLIVLPLGLLLSWALNVVRIAVLIGIGHAVSPDLAVNGFHSYAGWLFFILLALGVMALVHNWSWLHRTPAEPAPGAPLRSDWLAARIVPFVAMMLVSTLTSALFLHPELGYPLKAAVLAGVVALFLPVLRLQSWRPGPVAAIAGVAVGVAWVALAPEPGEDSFVLAQLLGSYSALALTAWMVCRVVGTVVLVPLIEELFFRGYVLARLDRGGMGWRILALAVSSLLFGLLHGRIVTAAAAGLVFGAVMLLRGRLADAVWAHAIANAVVALAALWRQDWALI